MIKCNFFKSLLLGGMLVAFSGQLWAQKSTAAASSDSISQKMLSKRFSTKVEGDLFVSNKNNSVSSVSTVSGETLYKTATPNIFNTLYGRLSGLIVNQGSGEPGNDNPDLGIRGVGTNSMGNQYNNYKIYVDGFEVFTSYLSYVSANDIESISILKDAAALAQFGMNGSNGVIWVVTKKGQGKLKITFNARTGFQSAIKINKPLGSYDYDSLYNIANSNDNGNVWTPKYLQTELDAYKNGKGVNVDWFDKVLRKNGNYSDANLTFSGGDKGMNYFVALNYGNQQGLYNVKNTDSTSNSQLVNYSVRANLNFKISKVFEANVGVYGRIDDRKSPNYSTGQLFSDMANYPANIYPVNDGITQTDGSVNINPMHYSGTSVFQNNPFASVNAQGWLSSRNRFLQGNFGLKEKLDFITKGLYLYQTISQVSYSRTTYNKTRNYARYKNGVTQTTTQDSPLSASSMSPSGQDDWKQANLMIGYDNTFGDHHLQSVLRYNLSSELGEGNFNYQLHNENFSGKLNYSFQNKYLTEFGFSYYGSDAFKPGNQWAFYPSVGAGWVVSNEKFLQGNSVISFLKVKGSAGLSGQAGSTVGNGINNYSTNGRYLYEQYYQNTGSFYTAGPSTLTNSSGLVTLFMANPNISAEKCMKYNVGLDFTLFNKLTVGVDLFLDKRSNIPVVDNTIPALYGNNIAINNIGKMTNKGIDVDMNFTDKIGDFGYTLSAMISFNRNKIDYMAEVPPAFSYNGVTGRPYGTQIGLVADGFYQIEDFNTDGTLKTGLSFPYFGKVQPGDIKYQDLDRDGKIDQNDVTAIGKSAIPEHVYSFGLNMNYKAFDFSLLFQGAGGANVNILSSAVTQVQAFVNNTNAFEIAKGAWAYYPDQKIDTRASATYPRLTTVANTNNYRASSFWIKNNDYLRVRNIELGFTFNPKLIAKTGLSKCRIFVNTSNPFTWSKLLTDYNMDPETYAGYPALKTFNGGISATF